eukprot:CAMPEP_0201477590 /NCGR_PEP_ID=MMETSP0151_2-20130828/2584_1 /ASSEMBLY_ACC=CAM_ASM_000257 /TAXON_ID=200890 /ORGANISM="Paramoeba atlantica, Strain 621/1 / CCAP 1560/9" /LENGTH=735 /DNA_ID=CAMNT_0047858369 /DNA_START=216 /DNA_END=2423 /DNA_ORIENTATION=-
MALISNGFRHTHEDLAETYNQFDSHPSVGGGIERGTGLAGLMNANANKKHIIGVAYNATLSNRIANRFSEDSKLIQCLTPHEIDVLCCAWFANKGVSYLGGPSDKVAAALEEGARGGRKGKGAIYVFGSGQTEYSYSDQDSNFDGYATNPFTITVGGVEFNKVPEAPGHVNPGTALFLVAPTSMYTDPVVSLSAKQVGSINTNFVDRDTPAALVTGVVALLLEANPGLNWFDVQNILAMTSWPIEDDAYGWVRNAVGRSHSRHFGFGLLNPPAAVQYAQAYTPTTLPDPDYIDFINDVPKVIENDANMDDWYDGKGSPLDVTFLVRENFQVSAVELYLTTDHEYCGDLEITVSSPSGTVARMAHPHHIIRQTRVEWFSEGRQNVLESCEETQYGVKWMAGTIEVDSIVVSSVDGCGEGEVEDIFPQTLRKPFPAYGNWVLLLETRESVICNFTERVKNAENAGAKGVFFVNEDENTAFRIYEETLEDVSIGALVLARTGGDILKQYAIRDSVVSPKIETQHQKNSVDKYDNWRMLDLVHWGEDAVGVWNVTIRDNDPYQDAKVNHLNAVQLRIRKSGIVPIPSPSPTPSTAPSPTPSYSPSPIPTPTPTPTPTPFLIVPIPTPTTTTPTPSPLFPSPIVPVPTPTQGSVFPTPSPSDGGLGLGAEIGVFFASVFGFFVLLVLIFGALYYSARRRRREEMKFKKFGGVVINENLEDEGIFQEEGEGEEEEEPAAYY